MRTAEKNYYRLDCYRIIIDFPSTCFTKNLIKNNIQSSKSSRDFCCHSNSNSNNICIRFYNRGNSSFRPGYTNALVIPAQSRNIIIEEVSGSPNYLALRSASGDFFLNGNWYIQWSGDYDVAGASGHYSRKHNRETFKTKGPITEDLHVMVSLLFNRTFPFFFLFILYSSSIFFQPLSSIHFWFSIFPCIHYWHSISPY